MKIAYAGIDILHSAMTSLLRNGCEIMQVFTCDTDNVTEFNTNVVQTAEKIGAPCFYEPITKEQLYQLKEEGCEAFFCAGYYHLIPVIEDMPMLNFHPAYLPIGRGAWPMPVTILKDLKTSGVTLHKMTTRFDEGDIVLQKQFMLEEKENLLTITEKINQAVTEIVDCLFLDFPKYYRNATPQQLGEYWKCPVEKDWTLTEDMELEEIDRILRAFYGYECLWKSGGRVRELIGGRLEKEKRGKWSVEIQGHYLNADKVRELMAEPLVRDAEIDFCYQQKIENIRKKYCHELSSHAFTSLYLWRKIMNLRLYLWEDMFTIKVGWRGINAWFFPCGNPTDIKCFLAEHKKEKNFKLIYVRPEDLEWLETEFAGEFHAMRDESGDEYIYDRQGHIDLKGKHYANVRTQYNKVLREHDVNTEILDETNLWKAEEILRAWKKRPREQGILSDEGVDNDGLEHRKQLGIQGVIVYMDKIPTAVVAGFPLSCDTIDLFLAKEREKTAGFAYYAKREFFRSLDSNYKYINIEEDLGMGGLRTMKKLLYPIRKNEMWEVVWTNEKE